MTVALSAPVKFSEVRGRSHPNNSSLVVGQQCGDGPKYQSAAVILGQMSATATTPNFDTKIDMHMQIGGSSDRLMFAQAFTSGNSACDTNDEYGRWPSFGVEFNTPVQTGKTVSEAFFVIILDYYDTPGGDVEFGRGNFARPASAQAKRGELDSLFTTDDTFKTPLVDSQSTTATPSTELPTAGSWTGTWTVRGTESAATLSLASISPFIGDITIPGMCAVHWTETERRSDTSRLVTADVTSGPVSSGPCRYIDWDVSIERDSITATDSADPSAKFSFAPS
ncbi:hypothetical protein [Mycobacterium sp. JS623]|uniref:hypothetical protein n=1 Tax=Mycobacterium sp. JS623 TaxID=212767 RepID=UPI0012FA4799|nr:hypothetical protein [Mycobacterium sp. JS623]